MTANSARPTYSADQIAKYFTHISLPQSTQDLLSHAPPNHAPKLNFLTQLQHHQLSTVPFENLHLHYSPHHTITLDPTFLYHKIVSRGHGGYCMENNNFFGTVLRTLGFEVCSVGARVSKGIGGTGQAGWHGWSHMVNIVTLEGGRRYMIDVGFGGNGPVEPMLMDDEACAEEEEAAAGVEHIEPAEARVVRGVIEQNTDRGQRLWQYQHRVDPQAEWEAVYCFTELEFLPEDYEIMSFWTSQSRKSWFTYVVVAVKMILEGGEVVGTLILEGGEVKKRVRGRTEHLRTCKTEEERVRALEDVFGLRLTDEERRGIRGMVTELNSRWLN